MNMCPSYKRKVPSELCLKGQVFFIWSSPQSHQIVQERITLLGGRIDSFLSKDITTVLVEDTQLLSAQFYPGDISLRPTYHSNSVVPSNYAYSNVVYNLPSTSRGYSFIASPISNSLIRVLGFARQWGIQILGITYFLSTVEPLVKSIAYLSPHPRKSPGVSSLSGLFIKVECFHKKFRPCYKMFNNDPDRLMPLRNANFLIKVDACNVILNKPPQLHLNQMNTKEKSVIHIQEPKQPVKVNEKKVINKVKPKEENNYCECCRTNFSDLKLHIKSANHQKFVSNEKNYETVHNVLKMLPSAQEFIQKHQKADQVTDLMGHNGETPNANITEVIDFSMPLALQVKKVASSTSLNLACEISPLLPIKKEDFSLPLKLQMKKREELRHDNMLEPSGVAVITNHEVVASTQKMDIEMGDSKQEISNQDCDGKSGEDLVVHPELNESLPNQTDPFDKNNTAAIAQLCLKNFDSYWLDNLPGEMDDIMFDDNIFDFDDCKLKSTNEMNQDMQDDETFSPAVTEVHELSPSFAPLDLKTGSTMNPSTLDSSTDMKIPMNVETTLDAAFVSVDKELAKVESPTNLKIDKSQTRHAKDCSVGFETKPIGSFYEKSITEINHTFPKALATKSAEQMFSSDSSDDENESVLISNVLNIITYNSDSEIKLDKGSCEEDSNSAAPFSKKANLSTNLKQVGAIKTEPTFIDTAEPVVSNKAESVLQKSPLDKFDPSPLNSVEPSPGTALSASPIDIMTISPRDMAETCPLTVPAREVFEDSPKNFTVQSPQTFPAQGPENLSMKDKGLSSEKSLPRAKAFNEFLFERVKHFAADGLVENFASSNNFEDNYSRTSSELYHQSSFVEKSKKSAALGSNPYPDTQSGNDSNTFSKNVLLKKGVHSLKNNRTSHNSNKLHSVKDSMNPHHNTVQSYQTDLRSDNFDAFPHNFAEYPPVNLKNPSILNPVSHLSKKASSSVSEVSQNFIYSSRRQSIGHSQNDGMEVSSVQGGWIQNNTLEAASGHSVTNIMRSSSKSLNSASNSQSQKTSKASKNSLEHSSLSSSKSFAQVAEPSVIDFSQSNKKHDSKKPITDHVSRGGSSMNVYSLSSTNIVSPSHVNYLDGHAVIEKHELNHVDGIKIVQKNSMYASTTDKNENLTDKTEPLSDIKENTMLHSGNKSSEQTDIQTACYIDNRLSNVASDSDFAFVNDIERTCMKLKERSSTGSERARVNFHSVSSLAAQSPVESPKTRRLPPKKTIRKLRKLPALWSVCILPGNGVKLKFTCVRRKAFVTIESDEQKFSSSQQKFQ